MHMYLFFLFKELCDQGIAEHQKIQKEKAAKTEKVWNQAKKNCNLWKQKEAEDEAEVDSKVLSEIFR